MQQLQHRFIQSAKKYGRKIAVHDQATGKDFTYDRLLIASLIMKGSLARIRGRYVGILLPTSVGCVLGVLGTLMNGKIPVMINYSTGAIENCLYAREKCGSKTILTSRKLLDKLNLEPIDHMVFVEDILSNVTIVDKLKAAAISKLPAPVLKTIVHNGPDREICVILFTSGSEKEPKAVQLTHRNIGSNVESACQVFDLRSEDICISMLPFFHVFGLTINLWLPLISGNTMVAHPNPLEYQTICSLVRKYKVTYLVATPSFFYGYLQKSEPGDFASIRFAIAGADKLQVKVYDGFLKKHGITIFEGYGTTETSPVISVNRPGAHKPGSIGPPLPGVKVRILDIDTGETLGPNLEGKILVKGDLVMEGYYNDYEETSMRIRNGWYDTGDIGIIDNDGFLWHRGRLKRFVKVGGEMVSLVNVEDVLSHLLPEDVICCVVDIPNPTKGADVVAAVANGNFDKHKVLKQLKKQLPSIAVPRQFYIIDNIPMMSSGKVNFREVEKICRSRSAKGEKK